MKNKYITPETHVVRLGIKGEIMDVDINLGGPDMGTSSTPGAAKGNTITTGDNEYYNEESSYKYNVWED